MIAKVLVFGSSSSLGTLIQSHSLSNDFDILPQTRHHLDEYYCDPLDYNQVLDLISRTNPDVVLNLIALTNVDECEDNPTKAFDINVLPVYNISKSISRLNSQVKYIHISTD